MKQINALLICLAVLFSISAQATPCSAVIDQIANDASQNIALVRTKPFIWRNLTWLLNALGEPLTQSIEGRLYEWEKYSLYTRSDGLTLSQGELPPGQQSSEPLSLEQAMAIFGQPKQIFSEKLAKYTWKCTSGTSLDVIVDKSGMILDLASLVCTIDSKAQSNCKSQSSQLANSDLESKVRPLPLPTPQEIKPQQLTTTPAASLPNGKNAITAYNEYFHEDIKTEAELQNKLTEKMKAYYANLRACIPGRSSYAYLYPLSGKLILSNVLIQKRADGSCDVETAQHVNTIGNINSKCHFLPNQLAVFTDQEAENAASGDLSYNSENLTPLQQVQKSQCQMFLNGKKVESV